MKLLLFVLLLCAPAFAEDVSLAWDPSVSPNITNYKIYAGRASRSYSLVYTYGNQTTATITELTRGTWYFAATAVDIDGNESDFSNEVSKTLEDPLPLFQITSMSSSRRFFGAVILCTTSRKANAILRYQKIEGATDLSWITTVVTTEYSDTIHRAQLFLDEAETGTETYYRYEWTVTDSDGNQSVLGGTFLVY